MSIVFDFAGIAARVNRTRRPDVQAWTSQQKSEWLNARNWEEICHKPQGSFRGLYGAVPCFEIE